VRRTPITLVALATAAVLTGCGPGGGPPPGGATPTPGVVVPAPGSAPVGALPSTGPTTTVMIIRHGEKPDEDLTGADAKGIDANGVEDDSSLTAVGWDRARRLADLFDPAGDVTRLGLARPTTIYAAGANEDGEGKRTRETVAPLAEKLGIPVNTGYGKGDEEKLVQHVVAQPGPTLISWQHGEIPSIAEAFPGVTPAPPSEWPDDRFDVVWVLTMTGGAWHFTQVPELVLPQDKPTVLTDDV
jgi:broad specificity phosphatase PhoE